MDQIEERLHDTSKNCFDCYEAWAKDKKDFDAREKLQESIHELRKVASRLEIELAVSERDEMAKRPIPIPPHRDANRKSNNKDDDNRGNSKNAKNHDHKNKRRGGGRKSKSSGGGKHGKKSAQN